MENNKDKELNKEFALTTISVKNKTTVYVLTAIIVILGLVSYNFLPKENFPEVKIPTVYVGTTYPGNAPADIENLITRPLEKEINKISNVNVINSNSLQDFSSIIVEFNTNVPSEEALRKVKDAVDKAKKDLPTDLDSDPNVFELNFSEFPIMNINLSGDYSSDRLKEYAKYLKNEIENVSEISYAEIRGVDDKEVKVNLDVHKMQALNITFDDVAQAIANENVTISGGNLLMEGNRRTIRVLGEFKDPKEMEDIIVKDEKLHIVYLRDIGTVDFGYKEKEGYARLGSHPVVMLDVVKRSGENLINASIKINKILNKAKVEVFPKDLVISITNDQSDQTIDQVSNLENSIISGVILVVLVLLFFLGTRNSMFVGVAIPLSMLLSFLILSLMGISINMMVLFGLIMALGMLVDNGIVVVENVYRLREQGYGPLDAAIHGVGEVALPIISSTATTLAAFLPLAFWPGMMGEFMKYLPYTLIISLGSSLFVALVINPVLVSAFMKVGETGEKDFSRVNKIGFSIVGLGFVILAFAFISNNGFFLVLGNLAVLAGFLYLLNAYVLSPLSFKFQNFFLPRLDNIYERVLLNAVKRPGRYFAGTFVALFFSLVLLMVFAPKVEFFPTMEPHNVHVFIEYPVGTDIQTTNALTEKVERRVMEIVEPYKKVVESVISHVAQGTEDPNSPSQGGGTAPNKARVTVAFVKFQLRNGISTSKIMREIRAGIPEYPGAIITVDQDAAGPPTGKPVNIEVTGEDLDQLIVLSDKIKERINYSNIKGIEELRTDLETGKPELVIEIDREKARRYGVSTMQVAGIIRTSLFGREVSKYKLGEDDYPIQIRLDPKYRYDIDALMNQEVIFRDMVTGAMRNIPIASIATAKYSSTYGSIKRKNLDRIVTIYSNVLPDYNANEINNQIRTEIADLDIPSGYSVKFTGEQEKQGEEMAFLLQALLIALFLIFLIIVAQFNKISAPVIIMFSVLFSTIGVFLGLVIFRMDFIIIMTMIGIISLAGIVVNNAIVLIDFIELIKARKKAELGINEGPLPNNELLRVIVEAGKTRLRPVLLTAITTVLGLIPLAVGLNFDFIGLVAKYDPDFYVGGDNVVFWGPMSWTIIFGLTFATFLTLVIVPVMYLLSERLKYKVVSR
ncbi:MAG: efflux RND transporter permease subunit [Cytophagaceae bacterium]